MLAEAEAGNGAAGFVVDIEDVVVSELRVVLEKPFFDDFCKSRFYCFDA